jgi:protein AATF/BFR2
LLAEDEAVEAQASDGDGEEQEEVEAPALAPAERRLPMRSAVDLGVKYSGKKVARQELFSEEAAADERKAAKLDRQLQKQVAFDKSSDEESSDIENGEENGDGASDEDDQSSERKQVLRPHTVDDADALQKELQAMMADQPYVFPLRAVRVVLKCVCSLLSSAPSEDEQEKGKHAGNQKALYDTLLDLRIRLQKSVNIANRLPAVSCPTSMLHCLSKSHTLARVAISQNSSLTSPP